MAKAKLESRQEKAKEKFEEKAKKKKEEEAQAVVGEKPKEKPKPKPKKKVEIKKPVVTEATGRGEYLPISVKEAVEVCNAIRNKPIKKAIAILNNVIALKEPIRYVRYKKDTPHRKGKGFAAGRYPKKTSKHVLKVVENAVANAEYLNLDPEDLYVKTAIPNRAISKERQGRYSNLRIVVAEKKVTK